MVLLLITKDIYLKIKLLTLFLACLISFHTFAEDKNKEQSELSKKKELLSFYIKQASAAIEASDFEKAFAMFEKSAVTLNDPSSMSGFALLAVADFSWDGLGTEKNKVRAGAIWYALIKRLEEIKKEHSFWEDESAERALKKWNKNKSKITQIQMRRILERAENIKDSDFRFF
jgi:hypothetical protein